MSPKLFCQEGHTVTSNTKVWEIVSSTLFCLSKTLAAVLMVGFSLGSLGFFFSLPLLHMKKTQFLF